MNNLGSDFHRQFFLTTGGFIPIHPFSQVIGLGDFFQFKQGKIIPLGNILGFNYPEEQDIIISGIFRLRSDDWRLSSGVHQTYCATEQVMNGDENQERRIKQIFEFEAKGSFIFHASAPECQVILNWSVVKDALTLILTQSEFSFRDVCVVTGITTVSAWALAVAGKPGAQLEISSDVAETDFFDVVLHGSTRAEQRRDVNIFQRQIGRQPSFFRAKKLVLKDEKKELCLRRILEWTEQREDTDPDILEPIVDPQKLASISLSGWMDTDWLNLVPSTDLNLATILDFFDWSDLSIDDLEKRC